MSGTNKLIVVIIVLCRVTNSNNHEILTSSGHEIVFHKESKSTVESRECPSPMDTLGFEMNKRIDAASYSADDSHPEDYKGMRALPSRKAPFTLELLGTEHQVCNGIRNPRNGSAKLLIDYITDYGKLLEKLMGKLIKNNSRAFELLNKIQKTKGPRFLRAKFNMSILNHIYQWNVSTQIRFLNIFNETKAEWANLKKYVTHALH